MVILSHIWIPDHFSTLLTIVEYRILGDFVACVMQSSADFMTHGEMTMDDNESTTAIRQTFGSWCGLIWKSGFESRITCGWYLGIGRGLHSRAQSSLQQRPESTCVLCPVLWLSTLWSKYTFSNIFNSPDFILNTVNIIFYSVGQQYSR